MILVYVIASNDRYCALIETNHVIVASLRKVTDPSVAPPSEMTHLWAWPLHPLKISHINRLDHGTKEHSLACETSVSATGATSSGVFFVIVCQALRSISPEQHICIPPPPFESRVFKGNWSWQPLTCRNVPINVFYAVACPMPWWRTPSRPHFTRVRLGEAVTAVQPTWAPLETCSIYRSFGETHIIFNLLINFIHSIAAATPFVKGSFDTCSCKWIDKNNYWRKINTKSSISILFKCRLRRSKRRL